MLQNILIAKVLLDALAKLPDFALGERIFDMVGTSLSHGVGTLPGAEYRYPTGQGWGVRVEEP